MQSVALDDSEKVSLGFPTWGVVFHTLHTEQFLACLLNRYNTINTFIPREKRAIIQVDMKFLSHSSLVPIIEKPDPLQSERALYDQSLIAM